jgi:hypothetical protein
MPHGTRFVDVLDDALRAVAWEGTAADEPRICNVPLRHVVYTPIYSLHTLALETDSDRVRPSYGTHVTNGFGTPGYRVEPWTASSESPRPPVDRPRHDAASHRKPSERCDVKPSTPPPVQPRRRLTPAQSRSLDAINGLGGRMHADFSPTELRSAFRVLARRYHPDRHPGAGEAERQRLAQQFSTLRTSYETLLAALGPAAS